MNDFDTLRKKDLAAEVDFGFTLDAQEDPDRTKEDYSYGADEGIVDRDTTRFMRERETLKYGLPKQPMTAIEPNESRIVYGLTTMRDCHEYPERVKRLPEN